MPSSLSRPPSGDVGDADSWLERCFRKFRWELLLELLFLLHDQFIRGVLFCGIYRECAKIFSNWIAIFCHLENCSKFQKNVHHNFSEGSQLFFRPNPPPVDMVNIFPMNHRVFVSMPTWNNRILCLKNGVFRWWGGICSLRFMQWSWPCFCFVPSSISRRLFIIFLAEWKQHLEESLLSILSLVPLERKHNGKNTL